MRKQLNNIEKITANALRESEEKFRCSFDYAPIGMALVSIDGKFLRVNSLLCNMLGFTEEELTKLTFQSITHPDDLNKDLQYQSQLINEELNYYQIEKRYITKSGSSIWVLLSVSMIHDSYGKPLYTIKHIQDITHQKSISDSLRESEQKFRNSFDYAPIGMGIVSPEGRWLQANSALCNIIGYTEEELQTMTFQELTHPDNLQEDLDNHKKLVNKECNYFQMEKKYFHKDGSIIWILLSVTLVWDQYEKPMYFIKQIQNITERKKMEFELENKNIQLQESNKELEQFAYIASHDLQEPLRTISSYSEILSRRYKDKIDIDADNFINLIVTASKRMKSLIEDVLEHSKIQKSIINTDFSDINTVIENIKLNIRVSLEENNVVLKYHNLPKVKADNVHMIQLFQNLITNSIKYRKDDLSPVITISVTQKNNFYIFSIEDNGIGISKVHQDKIFDIFKRLHTRDKYKGNGIGLASCKKIVELYGGKIWVNSEENKGSTFFFTLPIST